MKYKSDCKDFKNATMTKFCGLCKEPGEKLCQGCHAISYCCVEHQKEHWKEHKPNCCPFILKENQEYGRHLVASRRLRPGLFLIEESPLIGGPRIENGSNGTASEQSASSAIVCISCCKEIRTIVQNTCLCPKCKWPMCSVKCAKAKQHSENECGHFAKNKIKYNASILPPQLLYRGILLLRGMLKKLSGSPSWATIMYLQHERLDKSDVFNLAPESIAKLRTYFKILTASASDEELNQLNNSIEINAFSIERVEEENGEPSNAMLLYHKSSLITHSCTPNCTWSVGYSPSFSMRVRTSKEIKKGEMLTVSYNLPWNYFGTHRRKNIISETAGFICKCERCIDPTELGTNASGIKCKSGNCPGFLLPVTIFEDDDKSTWNCSTGSCKNSLPGNIATAKIESLENELSELQTIYMTVPMAGMKLFEDFIANNRDKVVHKNHWVLQQARRIITNIHGSQLQCLQWEQLESFVSHTSNLLLIWDVLAPGISVERGLHQLQLSRALSLQFAIKSEKLSSMNMTEKFAYLKKINDLQTKALLYWKDDIQTKPLDEDVGFEAASLQKEIINTLTQMTSLS